MSTWSSVVQFALLLLLLQSAAISGYGDHERHRLTSQAAHKLSAITNQAVAQATDLADNVVEDLLLLDSQNSIMLGYLTNFESFLGIGEQQANHTLENFFDIVSQFLDADAAEQADTLETQLIAMCLQRNGFDRWKRTVQLRTTQLVKSFGRKLRKHLDTLDLEERVPVEQRWQHIETRDGQIKLEKLRKFINWLGSNAH
ncbi:CG13488 [Drosophila busckii]|uniref:CG13488 n=1 Tax=Drosophila busckii TaxID=30019 RepID=A0A0M4EBN1_DROBS|nr:uncharacterized protein LOC108595825 [Drosophila busckii]ALC40965.1 CG13488 [Drosophila busckii]